MEYKRIFKDGIHLFAGKVGTVIITLANLIILSRVLTIEEMGKYSLFLMIVNLALILGLNWSDASIVRHGREEYVKHKKINQSFWARMYLFVPIILFFIIIFIIFAKPITTYIGVPQEIILLVLLMFILNGLVNFASYIYQSTDKMRKSAYVLFSQKLFYLILMFFVFYKFFPAKLSTIIIFLNLSLLITLIINFASFDYKKIFPYTFNKAYFKKIWSYSWPQLIGFPGLYIINYIDLILIKQFLTLHDVGVYNISYSAFIKIGMFIMLIHTIFLPLIVEYRTKKKHHMINNYVKKIPLFTAGWVVLVAIGLFLSPYIIKLLFSTKYIESIAPFNILLISSIFYFVSICLLPIVNAFDLIIYLQIFNLVKSGVNIALDFILIPKIGIIGAAYGTLAAYFVGMVLSITLLIIKRKKIFIGIGNHVRSEK